MLAKAMISGAISLAMTACGLSAQQLSPRAQAASERLSKVPMFAMGGVGFAGLTSKGEEDFRLIMEDPEAAKVFESLYAHGNSPAKAYALLGLHTLNPQRFGTIYASLANSKEDVAVMRGCIASKQKLKIIAKEIDGNGYVVKPQHRNRL